VLTFIDFESFFGCCYYVFLASDGNLYSGLCMLTSSVTLLSACSSSPWLSTFSLEAWSSSSTQCQPLLFFHFSSTKQTNKTLFSLFSVIIIANASPKMSNLFPKRRVITIGFSIFMVQLFLLSISTSLAVGLLVDNNDPRADVAFTAAFVLKGIELLVLMILFGVTVKGFFIVAGDTSKFLGGTEQAKLRNEVSKLRKLILSSIVGLFSGAFLVFLIALQENLFVSGVQVIAVLTIILPPALLSITGVAYIALTVRTYLLLSGTSKSTPSSKNLKDQDQ